MNQIFVFTLLLFSTINAFGQSNPSNDDITNTLNEFKKSIIDTNGESAVNLLSSHSLDYFEVILNNVSNSPKDIVSKLSIVDKMIVLGARQKLTSSEASKLDGKSFFNFAVKAGIVNKGMIKSIEISNIVIDGEKAQADIVTNNIETGVKLDFARENNKWKIDIISIYPATNLLLKNMIEMMGKDEDDFVLGIIEQNTGQKLTEEIWLPLNRD